MPDEYDVAACATACTPELLALSRRRMLELDRPNAKLPITESMLLLTEGPVDDAAEDDEELADVVAIDVPFSELVESLRFRRAAATAVLCRCASLAARSRSAAAVLAFVSW